MKSEILSFPVAWRGLLGDNVPEPERSIPYCVYTKDDLIEAEYRIVITKYKCRGRSRRTDIKYSEKEFSVPQCSRVTAVYNYISYKDLEEVFEG